MSKIPKIYVGTHVVIAKTIAAAQKDFNTGVAHICEEEGNPYHTALQWELSPDYDVCPDCLRPSHVNKGHYCPLKQTNIIIERPQGLAALSLLKDADLLANAVAFYCEHGLEQDPANDKAKTDINNAWKRVMTLAKTGLRAFESTARTLLSIQEEGGK